MNRMDRDRLMYALAFGCVAVLAIIVLVVVWR